MIISGLVILTLILANALYVAGEFAAVSVRRSRIRELVAAGNRSARWLLPVVEDARALDRYVAACQIGITLSSLLLGAYGQAAVAPGVAPLFERFGGLGEGAALGTASVVVLIGLTGLQVVFGELTPKTLALQYPTALALYTSIPMRWSLTAYAWFIAVLNGSGLLILRLLRSEQSAHRHIHSPAEIDLLIAESRDGGLLEPDEEERLHRALRLSVQPVRRLMVPRTRLEAVDIEQPVEATIQQVIETPYTRLPVYRESLDNVVGLLHTKDLATRLAAGRPPRSIEEVMRPVVSIPESARADRLLQLLRERHGHQAIVIDEFGGVAGLVTVEDALSEIFGSLGDEFKIQPRVEHLPDGRVRLPGSMRLDEAERWIGLRWDGTADTLGGHLTEILGHIPEPGELVMVEDVEVEVERMDNHVVETLLLKPAERAEAART